MRPPTHLHRVFRRLLIIILTSLPITLLGSGPNIILINADDLGYGDLSCYGATKIQTPNIDRLATEGRRFTDAHSASAVCSPSRYGMMTGQYPIRKNFWGPTPFTQELTIDLEHPTLASVLKTAGYDTAVIGKWHLGFGKGKTDWNKPLKPGPLEVGFDYYFGMPTVNSGPPFVYVENHSVVDYDPNDPFVRGKKSATQKWPEKSGYTAIGGAEKAHLRYRDEHVGTTFAERAVRWIKERNSKAPFFLYLATTNIHHPFTPHPRFKGTSQCGRYGDFVHELDWIVGEVLNTLDELKIARNTLVVFTSDNGGMLNVTGQKAWKAGHRLNGDLLGFKFGAWEGGHRVPFLARWPESIPAKTTSDALVSQIDLLATFAAAANATIPKDAVIDSVNQLTEFTGTATDPLRDSLVISPNSPGHLTIRKGSWVYIPAQDEGGFQGKRIGDHLLAGAAAQALTGLVNSDVKDSKIRDNAPSAQLYNLKADPRQTLNVHDEHPAIVEELATLLAESRQQIPQSPQLGWINIRRNNSAKPKPNTAKTKPAAKVDRSPSKRSVCLDFESGTLTPWKIVDGAFGHLVGSRETFFNKDVPYNKQGKHYLTTLEATADAKRGTDPQTGIVVSPLFIPKAGPLTFCVGGGNGKDTYVALCSADGKEVLHARGSNDQVMQLVSWNLAPHANKTMYLKIVDQATGGWGHITADHFEFDGKLLDKYPAIKKQKPTFGTQKSDTGIRHSFLIAGRQTVIVGEDASVEWKTSGQARDAFVLPNDNILASIGNVAKEMTRDGKVVWQHKLSKPNKELGTAVRLANGNTLVVERGTKPQLLEVTPLGEIAVTIPLQPETDNAHMQTRMARKLANGNYLVPHLLAFAVKEYAPDGTVVKTFRTDLEEFGGREKRNWPFTAIRLANGNTLVTLTNGNKITEFDANGKPVWTVTNADVDGRFADPCGAQRLANGNTIICSYGQKHPNKPKLFEVTPNKKVVWEFFHPSARAHEVHVLTTNGTAEGALK